MQTGRMSDVATTPLEIIQFKDDNTSYYNKNHQAAEATEDVRKAKKQSS